MRVVSSRSSQPGQVASARSRSSIALHEVVAVGVDRPDHDLVSEHEALVDPVGRDLGRAVAAGDAREDQDAVPGEDVGRLECDRAVAGRLDDQVERAGLAGERGQ